MISCALFASCNTVLLLNSNIAFINELSNFPKRAPRSPVDQTILKICIFEKFISATYYSYNDFLSD